jgi:hypothetical protein
VCDGEGIILEMNARAAELFRDQGGLSLIGSNLLECHPEPALSKLRAMLASRATNVYTIEKNGVKKLIYQAPWFADGEYAGFVELGVELPDRVPHFVRG